jgi:hypothetical protein
MNIKLLKNLPIAPAAGATKGQVFEVTEWQNRGGKSYKGAPRYLDSFVRLVYFIGDNGDLCGAFPNRGECEETKEEIT